MSQLRGTGNNPRLSLNTHSHTTLLKFPTSTPTSCSWYLQGLLLNSQLKSQFVHLNFFRWTPINYIYKSLNSNISLKPSNITKNNYCKNKLKDVKTFLKVLFGYLLERFSEVLNVHHHYSSFTLINIYP